LLLVWTGSFDEGDPAVPVGLPPDILEQTPATAPQIALGERLFFDPVLSSDRSVSCSSCHKPEHGFADTHPVSEGVGGRKTLRNTPTIFNRALGAAFMWDGRAATLEEQVLIPIENELEMDLSVSDAIARLQADATYRQAFEASFEGPPTEERLSAALAAFVRSRLYGGSRIDRFRDGERSVLTPAERGGLWIFESKGGCWRCHSGPNFSDESFHNTGIGSKGGTPEEGRFAITGDAADRGRFKTPTLRALSSTNPYMHDGSFATLEDVVAFYREGGRPNANLDAVLAPLTLSDEDAANLVAFLQALSEP
jgi:cytochrome c peroxidase